MTGKPEAGDPRSTAALQRAIKEAKVVAAEIRDAADHLAVVNTVLQDQIPEDVQTDELVQALEQSDSVEKSVTRSADNLDAVHSALEKAVAARHA